MEIDILGTNYAIREDANLRSTEADGVCQCYSKVILHRNIEDMLSAYDSQELKQCRFREVIRHEIIHAFFHEAGLSNYEADEALVDWIALQFPKLLSAMEKAGAILTGQEENNGRG